MLTVRAISCVYAAVEINDVYETRKIAAEIQNREDNTQNTNISQNNVNIDNDNDDIDSVEDSNAAANEITEDLIVSPWDKNYAADE